MAKMEKGYKNWSPITRLVNKNNNYKYNWKVKKTDIYLLKESVLLRVVYVFNGDRVK